MDIPAVSHLQVVLSFSLTCFALFFCRDLIGWVPFDEDDTGLSMGVDAGDSRGGGQAPGVSGPGEGEERSSSFDTTSLSSASDTEDVWTISDEQREYYITQFKTMQASFI